MSVLLEDYCRLCLIETGVENICHPVNIANAIFIITGVMVIESDELPQRICKKCLSIVNDAQKLRSIAQRNDTRLRMLVTDSICEEKEEKYNPKLNRQKVTTPTPSSSQNADFDSDATMKLDELSEESDITAESLLKRKKKYVKDSSRNSPWQCKVCKKYFVTRKKLSLHSRTHNKTFTCPLDACNKPFACNNDLQKHIRSHTGERPYKCDMCEKRFSQNGTLKNHKMSVHSKFDD